MSNETATQDNSSNADGNVVEANADNFENEVVEASKNIPVLVDFWAEWCGPCKAIASSIKEIAAEQKDKIKVAKVDVDSNQDIAARFNISAIPTLAVFKDGAVAELRVGALPKPKIIELVESVQG